MQGGRKLRANGAVTLAGSKAERNQYALACVRARCTCRYRRGMSEPQSLQHKVRQRQAARATLSGLVAAAFAFFLAGAAQANTG